MLTQHKRELRALPIIFSCFYNKDVVSMLFNINLLSASRDGRAAVNVKKTGRHTTLVLYQVILNIKEKVVLVVSESMIVLWYPNTGIPA